MVWAAALLVVGLASAESVIESGPHGDIASTDASGLPDEDEDLSPEGLLAALHAAAAAGDEGKVRTVIELGANVQGQYGERAAAAAGGGAGGGVLSSSAVSPSPPLRLLLTSSALSLGQEGRQYGHRHRHARGGAERLR